MPVSRRWPLLWLALALAVLPSLAAPVLRPGTTVLPPARNIPVTVLPKMAGPFTLLPNRVVLEQCVLDAGSAADKMKGRGTLKVTAKSGSGALALTLPGTTFTDLTVDAQQQMTGGTLTLPAAKAADVLGAGIGLDITGGTATVRTVRGRGVVFNLLGTLTTPYTDETGKLYPLVFAGKTLTLTLDNAGAVSMTSASNNSTVSLMSLAIKARLCAGGMIITPADTQWDFHSTEVAEPTFSLTCLKGSAAVSIPNLVTVDNAGLKLAFTNLVVDENGAVTAGDMDVPANGKSEVALANPAGFLLSVTDARVSFDKSTIKAFSLLANLYLPSSVSDDKGGRAGISPQWYDMLHGALISQSMDGTKLALERAIPGGITRPGGAIGNLPNIANLLKPTVTFYVNGYRLDMRNLVIDLTTQGPADVAIMPGINTKSWQGVFGREADITLPADDWSTTDGKPVTLRLTNCYVDANGFSGTVDAPQAMLGTLQIKGFNANLKRLHLVFGHNSITACDCTGAAAVENFDGLLNLTVKVGNTDTTAYVSEPSQLSNEKLGVALGVKSGVVNRTADGKSALWLNGSMSLNVPDSPTLAGCALGFTALGIADGGFVTTGADGWFNLDGPASADFGILHCNVSSCAFQREKAGAPWKIFLNGEFSLNGDIPVVGTLNTQPLVVQEGTAASGNKPTILYSDIGINADVMQVVGIVSSLKVSPDPTTHKPRLLGDAALMLSMAGDSPALSAPDSTSPGFKFVVHEGSAWAICGQVQLPMGYMIPLGQSGLGIYKFIGGLARNMKVPPNGDFTNVGTLIPTPNAGTWLLNGGIGVGLISDFDLFHAEGTLTVGLPNFNFNIHGDGWLLTSSTEKPGQVVVDVALDPTVPMFSAHAAVDIGFPTKDIIHVNGELGLLVSPDDVHLDIGWPYPDNADTCTVLGGVMNTRFGSHWTPKAYSVAAGTDFNYWVFKGSIEGSLGYNLGGEPYLSGSVWASGEVDFWIASIGASASLSADLYDDYLHLDGHFRATIGTPWPLPDIHVGCHFDTNIS